tara:strand:+ start:740 stop:1927 length:1188 start_codon:yes stop_codon:yes gene_type:complete
MQPVQTLDSHHKAHLAELSSKQTLHDEIQYQIDNIKNELKTCSTCNIPKLTFKLNELNVRLENINCQNEIEYYLNAGPVLFEYYKNIDDVANGYVPCNDHKVSLGHRSIIDYFHTQDTSENSENNEKKTENEHNQEHSTNTVRDTEYRSRNDLLAEYLALIKNEVPIQGNTTNQMSEEELYTCNDCGCEMNECFAEAYAECPNCGMIQSLVIDVEKPWYKEPPREVSNYSYKRSNHFNEHVAYFQAKETTRIPQLVIDKVLVELNKNRVKNIGKLSHEKIREILRKLGLSKYYEHVPHILNQLNGVAPPVMSCETEERLRLMFREIQIPFARHCPRDRKNFLSYSYVLHKFVELLELDQFKSCFTLLKSREKLYQQDLIWEKICKDLGWQFIKSI